MNVNPNAGRLRTADQSQEIKELREKVAKQAERLEALEKRVAPEKKPEVKPA